jgi:ATP-dependent RNA helicase DeaD
VLTRVSTEVAAAEAAAAWASADVAAALAVLFQDGESFLLAPEAPQVRRKNEAGAGDRDRPAVRVAGQRRTKSEGPLATYRIRVGRRHKVQPGAIVGAIANEGGLTRQDFGHIDIKIDHSLVELPADLPPRTLDALSRTRISGQLIELTREDGGDGGVRRKKPRHKA